MVFYNGFDQYARETRSIELTEMYHDEEETLEIVTQLWIKKVDHNRPAVLKSHAEAGERAYYDVEVLINGYGVSLETGESVVIPNGGPFSTQYCSNNFQEHMRFWGIDPERANRTAELYIKKRFTAEQLLSFYRQGLTLQERLMELYCEEMLTS